ncbi:MAG TPA: ATP-binding protein [Longimicrobiales bacterium]|nr:ATP-binding protein [Longimicrobiales bacterium]
MKEERRNPFRSSLVVEPIWRRIVLAVAAVGIYTAAFVPLFREGDTGVLALALFPVVILGWLFGAWGGLLAGILSVPLNALLLVVVGEPGWELVIQSGGAEGSALIVVVGCVIGLLRDLGVRLDRHLTDWRRAERALRETEDRYRILFERSRDPMYVTRAGGGFVEANDALVRLFGYGRAELLELDVSRLYVDPGDRERFIAQISRTGWVEDFPVQLRTKSGDVCDCLITATARRNGDGEIDEYQGSIRDVSEDSALHELAERRTRELQEAVAELEAFTYSVSHDLRTHLVTLGGFASILWSDHREGLPPRAQDFLERMVASSRRMDRFVRDLLTYGRVTRAPVRPESVSLAETVTEAQGTLAAQIEERNAVVVVENELPFVRADRTLLGRVLENLISNAVKFVPAERTPQVRIRARAHDRHVRLEIQDNGIGIAEADQARAFRAFERLDPAHFQGTGVGLSIVQKSVERMGGEVGVTSRIGEGSTFHVLLRSPGED